MEEVVNAARKPPEELELTPIGVDDFSRLLYRGSDGQPYVDVDGTPHTMTESWGEPIEPVSKPYRYAANKKATGEI